MSEREGRPLRVAVVGAGPSGLFAADDLCTRPKRRVQVDVLDRLPTPYGLVRYGVAPDHPSIKSVATSLEAVLDRPDVRFLGGVHVGTAVTRTELLECYDAVLYATGAPRDRRLGIPGEDLPGSISATDFVAWYNGHPDHARELFLDASAVAVIGVGNVALDVGRMLTRDHETLAGTDIPSPVLVRLRASLARDVSIIGRRGPEHAKFTGKELREIDHIDSIDPIVDPLDLIDVDAGGLGRAARTNVEIFGQWSTQPRRPDARRLSFRFAERPVEIQGSGRVEALRVERTRVADDGRVLGTGEFRTLPVQLVVRAVGYRSVALPGVPFDEERGVVPNHGGRVIDQGGSAAPREYVAGWLKRGPTGVIGTNKSDARETVRALVEDFAHVAVPPRPSVDEILARRGVRWASMSAWRAIDRAEIARGEAEGRLRCKIHDWPTLDALVQSESSVTEPRSEPVESVS